MWLNYSTELFEIELLWHLTVCKRKTRLSYLTDLFKTFFLNDLIRKGLIYRKTKQPTHQPLLTSLPGPLNPRVLVPDSALLMDQIELFDI